MRSVLALLAVLACASAAVPQLSVVPTKQRVAAARSPLAVVIPGDTLAEVVLVDGTVNFLSIYSGVLTLRIRAHPAPTPAQPCGNGRAPASRRRPRRMPSTR